MNLIVKSLDNNHPALENLVNVGIDDPKILNFSVNVDNGRIYLEINGQQYLLEILLMAALVLQLIKQRKKYHEKF